MTAINDLVNQIERDHLVPITRPEYDTVATSYNTSATGVALTYTDTLLAGSLLDIGFELLHVHSWNENTRTATVHRGHLGTTAAAGTAGDMVRINPRFSSVSILDAVSDELRSWDDRLFRVERESLSFGVTDSHVEANPSAAPWRLLDARVQPQTTVSLTSFLGTSQWAHVNAWLSREDDTSQFASGYGVHVAYPFGRASTLDVFYALPFDLTGLSSSSDLLATHGLTDGMLEILKWGALWRLMAGRETARADINVHGRPDVQQNVGAGVLLQEAGSYKKLRDDTYDREVRKLLAVWPIRFAG